MPVLMGETEVGPPVTLWGWETQTWGPAPLSLPRESAASDPLGVAVADAGKEGGVSSGQACSSALLGSDAWRFRV